MGEQVVQGAIEYMQACLPTKAGILFYVLWRTLK